MAGGGLKRECVVVRAGGNLRANCINFGDKVVSSTLGERGIGRTEEAKS